MEDKRKAVANNDGRRQRQRREREAPAVEDTATSGRTTATTGSNGTLQGLPRVTAATTPALGPPPVASSQFAVRPRGEMADKGKGKAVDDTAGTSSPTSRRTATAGWGGIWQEPPPGASSQFSEGNAGAPQGHGSSVIDQQRLRDQPSSSRAAAPGCTCCGGAPTTRVVLNLPMCEACYRRAFQGLLQGNAPQQHAQIGYAGAPRVAVRNPVAVEQQFWANLDAPSRPFTMSGPICEACGGRSGSNNECQACYKYAQTSNVPPQHTLTGNVPASEQQLQAELQAQQVTSNVPDAYSGCTQIGTSRGDLETLMAMNGGVGDPAAPEDALGNQASLPCIICKMLTTTTLIWRMFHWERAMVVTDIPQPSPLG